MRSRCPAVDDDGCRCLRRDHDEKTPHDFSYTPWTDAVSIQYRRGKLGIREFYAAFAPAPVLQ